MGDLCISWCLVHNEYSLNVNSSPRAEGEHRKEKGEGNAKGKGMEVEVHNVTGNGAEFEYLLSTETWYCLGK